MIFPIVNKWCSFSYLITWLPGSSEADVVDGVELELEPCSTIGYNTKMKNTNKNKNTVPTQHDDGDVPSVELVFQKKVQDVLRNFMTEGCLWKL